MSQLGVDNTISSPCWQGESNTDEAVLAGAGIEGQSTVAIMSGVAGAQFSLSSRDVNGLPRQWIAGECRRKAPTPHPVWKRTTDVVGATVLLAILLPFLFAIALYIKCVSRGPVLFRQLRFGVGGRPFKVWKFRTIEVSDASAHHRSHLNELIAHDRPLEKCDDELEVIQGGGLLRRFGIDELPQLINVLKGEMSLVGPRPDVVPICEYARWQRRRFEVLPGITGLWQVNGKNRTTFSTMMRLDAMYVRRRSFWLDVSILLRTIPAIVLG